MKSSGSLRRKTPLRASSSPQRRAAANPNGSCRKRACGHPGRFEGFCGSHAMNEADRLFSLYVRARDGGCVNCFKTERLQCAHLVSREYKLTRYARPNAVCLCQGCHFRFTGHPVQWWRWCDERWAGRIEKLEWFGRYGVRRGYHPDYGQAIRKCTKLLQEATDGKATASRW